MLAQAGVAVASARQAYTAALADPLTRRYAAFERGAVELSVEHAAYYSSREAFGEYLRANRQRDIAAGATLSGPHRSSVTATIDGLSVGSSASRGQTRSFLLAVRLGQYDLLSAGGARPLLVFDDVFSELDSARQRQLCEYLPQSGVLIATTKRQHVDLLASDRLVYDVSLGQAATCRQDSRATAGAA